MGIARSKTFGPMAWFYLLIAGFFEIGWAMGMKLNHGFTRFWPTAATLVCMVSSLAFLSFSLKSIPIGTGYAVWTGIGAAGTAMLGMVLLGESRDILRLVCLGLIVVGVLGLKFVADRSERAKEHIKGDVSSASESAAPEPQVILRRPPPA